MKKHSRITAGMISAVIAVSAFSTPSYAVGRISPPSVTQSKAGAIYEGEAFAETLTPPSKTTYTEGEEIDFSDFEIGTVKMTQKIVDGELKESFERIAYWVNWAAPDCYKILDADGNEHDGADFTKLKAGKYTVVFDSFLEFSETKDHKMVYRIGGCNYSYEITINKGTAPVVTTTTAPPVASTTTTPFALSTTTSTLAITSATLPTTSEPPTDVLSHNIVAVVEFDSAIKVGRTGRLYIMDYPANNTKIKVENKNEDIVSFTQTSDTGGTITALKAGTAKLIVNGNNVVITVEEDTASTTAEATQTTEASASTTTTTTTQTSPVNSGEGVHYLFIRNLTLTVDGTTDYGLGLDPPKAGEYTIKAEDESILKIEDYGTGKGKITALKPGKTTVIYDVPDKGEHFKSTIKVYPMSEYSILFGDANCDNDVSLADSVLIMQSIANPAKFGMKGTDTNHITTVGTYNGDVNGCFDGITNADALLIQKAMLGLVTELDPLKRDE